MNGFQVPPRRKYLVSASVRQELKEKKRPVESSYKPPDFDVVIPLPSLVEEGRLSLFPKISRISVGVATCGRVAGAQSIMQTLVERDWENQARVVSVGCLGACYAEPLVDIRTSEGRHYFFGGVDRQSLWSIITTALGSPPPVKHLWAVAQERQTGVLRGIHDLELIQLEKCGFKDFFHPQVRRISGRCGLIDPQNITEYAATGGYQALAKALFELKPKNIIQMIEASGLRGRGGAGFPTGEKWYITSESPDPMRIVVANADEGDPGAYMDRALLESDPYSVLEGLVIAAYAIGASQGYIFVRHEYPLAVQTIRNAISTARKVGLLGRNIMGSSFCLEISVVESAGAFVCGEETSMLQVMENKRGEPRCRPPYPAVRGLQNHPTLINNVETLANIPWIIQNGADAYRELGTATSPGTKIFCLAGAVERMGFIEVPLGTDTHVLVEKIGGASRQSIKSLHIGGPSGGIIPYRRFNLDYESVAATGAIMGSGGLVVLDQNSCMVNMARHMINFMAQESCGKCVFCRDGLPQLESLLLELCIGSARDGILEAIEELSRAIRDSALCGLGRTAVNPVLSTIKDFFSEYEAHLRGCCPAVHCKPLIDFEILLTSCRDCKACYLVCPSGAVKIRSGRERYIVDRQLCSKCWACYETCPFDCIKITSEEFMWKNS
ncbi:NADH-quinone oxidoreductase subunit F [Dehalobacter sp. DCM]|uniref:NADH-ubiquinone oxidoreductase-F iron-sulfur binding region domain-containing protein n=1 Tax=Dehalobacter sp. DCM TaxID=2907827 RepID=UPI0030812D17|nr:NADH-quinone oxidoreductase subunit F [Dehalobacter sp. DCM]